MVDGFSCPEAFAFKLLDGVDEVADHVGLLALKLGHCVELIGQVQYLVFDETHVLVVSLFLLGVEILEAPAVIGEVSQRFEHFLAGLIQVVQLHSVFNRILVLFLILDSELLLAVLGVYFCLVRTDVLVLARVVAHRCCDCFGCHPSLKQLLQ